LLELADETPDVLDRRLMVEAALEALSLLANGNSELRIWASAFWLYDLDLLGIAGRAAVGGGGCMRAASAPPRTNTAAAHQTTCENTTTVSLLQRTCHRPKDPNPWAGGGADINGGRPDD